VTCKNTSSLVSFLSVVLFLQSICSNDIQSDDDEWTPSNSQLLTLVERMESMQHDQHANDSGHFSLTETQIPHNIQEHDRSSKFKRRYANKI